MKTNLSVAIMQPSLLPWGGFFSIANCADVLILLDNVMFSKSTSHNRFFMNIGGLKVTHTVPVFHKGTTSKLLKDITIRTDLHPRKIVNAIAQAYPKRTSANHFVVETILQVLRLDHSRLVSLNYDLILATLNLLGFAPRIYWASELLPHTALYTNPVQRLLDLLHTVNANHYIMPSRSLDYARPFLHDFHSHGFRTSALYYNQIPYHHPYDYFIPNLSIFDMLIHEMPSKWRTILSNSTIIKLLS